VPVRKLARLGVQMGLWQQAWVNAVPELLSASSRGVET
jgi:hypothetical protein